ncbi:hypothetical protein FHS63_002727 [Azospirillum doebereinerae]|nr:hypothetical protein [Azospirillum doebereinerae]
MFNHWVVSFSETPFGGVEEALGRVTGRPAKHPVPSADSRSIADTIAAALPAAAFRRLSWRQGTKGPLQADFAAEPRRVCRRLHFLELCGNLGDDGLKRAADRGG